MSKVEFAKDVLFAIGFVEEEGKSFLEWKNDSNLEEAQAFLVKDAAALLNKLKRGESTNAMIIDVDNNAVSSNATNVVEKGCIAQNSKSK